MTKDPAVEAANDVIKYFSVEQSHHKAIAEYIRIAYEPQTRAAVELAKALIGCSNARKDGSRCFCGSLNSEMFDPKCHRHYCLNARTALRTWNRVSE